jgi:putative adhesin
MADNESFSSPAEIRHRIGATGTFGLNNVSGDIRLRGNDTDEVTVVARWDGGGDDRPLPLTVRRGEGSLHIETDEKSNWLSFRNHNGITFEVSAPAGARIDVNAVSSDIEVQGLVGEQSYKTVSGDLVLDGSGGRVSATTVSGDVQLTGAQPIEVNVTTTSGDVEASAPTFQPVRMRTVSGDMTVRGGFAAGPQHTVESVSGDLSIEATSGLTVDTKRGLDFSKGSKAPMVSGDGTAQLRFRSLSGDVQLSGASAAPSHQMNTEDSLEVLRALERGEIDVEEASRRLEGAGSRG